MTFPTVTPRTWTVGEIVTAANLNLHLRNQMDELAAAWESHTVAWTATGTAPSIGDGELIGRYKKIGRTVLYFIRLTWGSTTSGGTGTWDFSMPFDSIFNSWPGLGFIWDNSTVNNRQAAVARRSGTAVCALYPAAGGGVLSATFPITWALNDVLTVSYAYSSPS